MDHTDLEYAKDKATESADVPHEHTFSQFHNFTIFLHLFAVPKVKSDLRCVFFQHPETGMRYCHLLRGEVPFAQTRVEFGFSEEVGDDFVRVGDFFE